MSAFATMSLVEAINEAATDESNVTDVSNVTDFAPCFYASLNTNGFVEQVHGLDKAFKEHGWIQLDNWCSPCPDREGAGWIDPNHPTRETAALFLKFLIKSIVTEIGSVKGRTIFVIGDSTLSYHFGGDWNHTPFEFYNPEEDCAEWRKTSSGEDLFAYNYSARKAWCDLIAQQFDCTLAIGAVPGSKFSPYLDGFEIQSQIAKQSDFGVTSTSPIYLMVGGWNEKRWWSSHYTEEEWADWCASMTTQAVA
jgi:hypothetical protein